MQGLIKNNLEDFQYGISIGKKLDNKIVDKIYEGPTIEYYEHYHKMNYELSELAKRIKSDLKTINVDSVIVEPTIATTSKEFEKYMDTLTVEVSHKMVATRAGLGWIGKTDLFISKNFGPRLRLVSILINHPVQAENKPVEKSKCGKCNICVESCPAEAANGKLWNKNIKREGFYDAFKCRDKCEELTKERLNIDKRICGICVAVCPIGKPDKNNSLSFSKK